MTDQTEKNNEKKRFPGTITSNVSVVVCGHWGRTGVSSTCFIVFKGNPPFCTPRNPLKSRHQSKLYVFNINLQWDSSLHCMLSHCYVKSNGTGSLILSRADGSAGGNGRSPVSLVSTLDHNYHQGCNLHVLLCSVQNWPSLHNGTMTPYLLYYSEACT